MTRFIKLTISIIIFLLVTNTFAQDFQGKAYYKTVREFKLKLDSTSKIPNDQQLTLQKMIKDQMQKTYILTFNKTKSTYKEEAKLDKPVNSNGISIKIGNSNDVLYKDLKNKIYLNAKENYGKLFLIKDSLKTFNWKFEKETKKIGKYNCLKATTTKTITNYDFDKKEEKKKEIIVTAWYAPEIPISNGPEFYYGLPGLILELHEDKMHYLLTKLVLNPKDKKEIKAPKKGKKVNQKQYDKIMKRKEKEMMENFKSSSRKKGNTMTQTIIIN